MNAVGSFLSMRQILALTCLWACGLVQAAGTSTIQQNVKAQLNPSCTVTVTAMAFNTLTSTMAGGVAQADATSNYTIRCTTRTSVALYIDQGSNATSVPRMINASGQYLPYQIYYDSARTGVFSPYGAILVSGFADASGLTGSFYGRVPAQSNIDGGNFTDSVGVYVDY